MRQKKIDTATNEPQHLAKSNGLGLLEMSGILPKQVSILCQQPCSPVPQVYLLPQAGQNNSRTFSISPTCLPKLTTTPVAAAHKSGFGTKRTCRHVSPKSVMRSQADLVSDQPRPRQKNCWRPLRLNKGCCSMTSGVLQITF
jgi:hypothetical protein